MTISILELSRAIKKDLSLEKYIVLRIAEDGVFYLFPPTHFPNTISELKTNGYLNGDNSLTIKGKALLKEIQEKEVVKTGVDYKKIREELSSCLLKNHGKKQVKGFGDVYFIPTETELIDSLKRFWKHYPDYKDTVKITEILKNHIETCSKKNKFAPAIRYFIIKMGASGVNSPLAAAYESWEEEVEEVKEKEKLIDTKDLF